MGQFYVSGRVIGPTGIEETLDLLVDTGATFLCVPRKVADALGLQPKRSVPIITAGGREEMWPVAEVRIVVVDREVPTLCFIAPEGPALLGAVALESLLLAVDPVAKRLVPAKAYVMAHRASRAIVVPA